MKVSFIGGQIEIQLENLTVVIDKPQHLLREARERQDLHNAHTQTIIRLNAILWTTGKQSVNSLFVAFIAFI